ncbi:SNF2 family N-terminal domain-containing protein [Terfezia claveryi]|nr:SNF2 family N-terminal domain-containing protein [Terfezia claveryi]
MPVEMPLVFKQKPLQHSSVNDRSHIKREEDEQAENSDRVHLIDFSGHRTQVASELEKAIGVHAVDQATLERDVALEASRAINEKEDEFDSKRLQRTQSEKDKLLYQLGRLHDKLEKRSTKPEESRRVNEQIEILSEKILGFERDIRDINERIRERSEAGPDVGSSLNAVASGRMPNETQREFLIRTGKITPFAKLAAEDEDGLVEDKEAEELGSVGMPMSHQNLRMPGFAPAHEAVDEELEAPPPKKRRRLKKAPQAKINRHVPDKDGDSEYGVSGGEDDESEAFQEEESGSEAPAGHRRAKSNKRKAKATQKKEDFSSVDDGNERQYQGRLKRWIQGRKEAREKENVKNEEVVLEGIEWHLPHPTIPDYVLGNGYCMPGDIYPSLFDYQKTCVQWLWELHQQDVGGIIGDEMGLGKTIQIISFLAGLHYSRKLTKPVLIVAPATVLKQWVNEFHKWWPPLRVPILHSSGSGMLNVNDEEDIENKLEHGKELAVNNRHGPAAERLVNRVSEKGHVLVTTYAGLQTYGSLLLEMEWSYAILDEGHKIRNPDAGISLACKQLKTPHRIILSGTPMQNNLTELWSLFDFIYPGRLGVLPVFQSSFAVPIRLGGYANATNVQIRTSYQCACVLRDLVGPYLLRRLKLDVAADLPKKVEQVLFCKLTKAQRNLYEEFLKSSELKSIMDGKRQVLYGVDILRKICNHPDLVDKDKLVHKEGYHYGKGTKSGKMQVVKALLEIWKSEGHRTLLFSQTRQMLDILESYLTQIGGYKYLRMDGATIISHRQQLVDDFNNTPEIDLFLLTTKVGGLGVNLTGADRVIIFDPDWNPSTDVQARERAWRLGQTKDVTIYRLMTAGTIEEKIYHRQIFKQLLTNKILKDPKQRRFFKMNDLHDLFTLGSDSTSETETGYMFQGAEKSYNYNTRNENDDDPDKVMQLGGVAGLAPFQTQEDEQSEPEEAGRRDEAKKSDDIRVLEGILGKSGVRSALEHDQIINAAEPEDISVQREAKKVVDAAAAALRASRNMAMKAKIGTPTWTGKKGSAGRVNDCPSYSNSACSMGAGSGTPYKRLKGDDRWLYPVHGSSLGSDSPWTRRGDSLAVGLSRSHSTNNATSKRTATSTLAGEHGSGWGAFVDRLREYLVFHGGKATHKEIVAAFEDQMRDKDIRTEELKGMLREVAVYGEKTRTWKIKIGSGADLGQSVRPPGRSNQYDLITWQIDQDSGKWR